MIAENDWREFKGYLRDTAKLPTHKVTTEEEQQWFNKTIQRLLLLVLLVLLVWALYLLWQGAMIHGAVQNVRSAVAAAWSDAWSDVAGVDNGSDSLGELEQQADRRFLAEEHAYWQVVRPSVLHTHYGQWVAVVGGKMVATGGAMNKVAASALRSTGKAVMFVAQVGHEQATVRVLPGVIQPTVQQDSSAAAAAAAAAKSDSGPWYPLASMVLRGVSPGAESITRNVSFLVDTGADLSAVTPSVAAQLQLRLSPVGRVRIAGWSGIVTVRQVYLMMARLAGEDVVATVDVDAELCVLGRDILNDFELQASATHQSILISAAKGSTPSWEDPSACNCTAKCDDSNGWWVPALDDVVDSGDSSYENRVLWYTVAVQTTALICIIIAPRMNGGGATLVKKWI